MNQKVTEIRTPEVQNIVRTRIPTEYGNFTLFYYTNTVDNKEHVAMVKGDVSNVSGVPVRIHSECFTGDVLGSRRCDCRDQLQTSMNTLGGAECGVLIYLRQEGRGIGLLEKLKAYNLQDQGLDTVDANIQLGHRPDERSYQLAALILNDLKVSSVQIMTNNPTKISQLNQLGIQVDKRIPIEVGHHTENAGYLKTKAERMAHMLSLGHGDAPPQDSAFLRTLKSELENTMESAPRTPFVTVSYAQSIDGSIAAAANDTISLSCERALEMTHLLRAEHDALLVGINTILTDDPHLNVRYHEGPNPQPVVLDSHLRFPLQATLLQHGHRPPIILTTHAAPQEKEQQLLQAGARVIRLESESGGRVDIPEAMSRLREMGFRSIMVEGGASVIGQFLGRKLADYCVVTIAPRLIGGLKAFSSLERPENAPPLSITDCQYHRLGSDMIIYGSVG